MCFCPAQFYSTWNSSASPKCQHYHSNGGNARLVERIYFHVLRNTEDNRLVHCGSCTSLPNPPLPLPLAITGGPPSARVTNIVALRVQTTWLTALVYDVSLQIYLYQTLLWDAKLTMLLLVFLTMSWLPMFCLASGSLKISSVCSGLPDFRLSLNCRDTERAVMLWTCYTASWSSQAGTHSSYLRISSSWLVHCKHGCNTVQTVLENVHN